MFGKKSTFVRDTKPLVGIRDILKNKSRGSILDLGCGNGRNIVFLLELGNFDDITCVDFDNKAIEETRKNFLIRNINANLIESDLNNFNFLNKKYDIIICSLVLPYMNKDVALNLITKIKQHTKSGGINYISVYTDTRIKEYKENVKTVFGDWELSHSIYNDWRVINDLSKAFFQTRVSTEELFNGMYIIAQKP